MQQDLVDPLMNTFKLLFHLLLNPIGKSGYLPVNACHGFDRAFPLKTLNGTEPQIQIPLTGFIPFDL